MTFDDDGDLRPLRTERVLPERPLVAPDQVEDALRRPAVPSA